MWTQVRFVIFDVVQEEWKQQAGRHRILKRVLKRQRGRSYMVGYMVGYINGTGVWANRDVGSSIASHPTRTNPPQPHATRTRITIGTILQGGDWCLYSFGVGRRLTDRCLVTHGGTTGSGTGTASGSGIGNSQQAATGCTETLVINLNQREQTRVWREPNS